MWFSINWCRLSSGSSTCCHRHLVPVIHNFTIGWRKYCAFFIIWKDLCHQCESVTFFCPLVLVVQELSGPLWCHVVLWCSWQILLLCFVLPRVLVLRLRRLNPTEHLHTQVLDSEMKLHGGVELFHPQVEFHSKSRLVSVLLLRCLTQQTDGQYNYFWQYQDLGVTVGSQR